MSGYLPTRRQALGTAYSVLSSLYVGSVGLRGDPSRDWQTKRETPAWTALAQNVTVSDDTLTFELSDGRTISAPLLWYPRLAYGTREERNNWEIGSGIGVHWPDLDEDISVEGLLLGGPSRESGKSLQRWLDSRGQRVAG